MSAENIGPLEVSPKGLGFRGLHSSSLSGLPNFVARIL